MNVINLKPKQESKYRFEVRPGAIGNEITVWIYPKVGYMLLDMEMIFFFPYLFTNYRIRRAKQKLLKKVARNTTNLKEVEAELNKD